MKTRNPQRTYRWLAEHYDRVFTFHHAWRDAAHRGILGSVPPGVKTACDLACGSGTTALKLAKRGIRTHAVDLSPVMRRVAQHRAHQAGLRLRVSRQDMRAFRLPEPVDLVLCEFDALNPIPQKHGHT